MSCVSSPATTRSLAVAGPLTSSACEVTFPVANQMKIVSTSQASSKPGVAKANRPWAFRNTVDEGILAKVRSRISRRLSM